MAAGRAGVAVGALVASFGVVLVLGLAFGTGTASSDGPRPHPTSSATPRPSAGSSATRPPTSSPAPSSDSVEVTFDDVRVGATVPAQRGVTVTRPAAGTVCAALPNADWSIPNTAWQLQATGPDKGRYCEKVDAKKAAVRVHVRAKRT